MQCTWRDRHGRAKLWLPWQHWHGHTRKGGQGSLAEKAYWQRLPPSTLPTGVGFMPTHVSYVLSSASVASGPPLAYRAWRGVLDLSREPRPDLRAKVKKKKKIGGSLVNGPESESLPNMALNFPYKYLDLCVASLILWSNLLSPWPLGPRVGRRQKRLAKAWMDSAGLSPWRLCSPICLYSFP